MQNILFMNAVAIIWRSLKIILVDFMKEPKNKHIENVKNMWKLH